MTRLCLSGGQSHRFGQSVFKVVILNFQGENFLSKLAKSLSEWRFSVYGLTLVCSYARLLQKARKGMTRISRD